MRFALLMLGIILVNPLFAQTEKLKMPICLAAKLKKNYRVLAENSAFKILEVPSEDLETLVHLADESQENCGHFVNLSNRLSSSSKIEASKALLVKPVSSNVYEIKHQKAVNTALEQIDSANIWQTLIHMTAYPNRSATEKTGLLTAKWLKAQFDRLVLATGREDTVAYFVDTGAPYQQPSLVTVIGKNLKRPGIVIGAHMDTLSGLMPGAGDDASGSATIMEMARILVESNHAFKRPIYIIWYAAEERGLVGSQQVVSDFLAKGIPVKAAIQFDMTGYRHDENDPTMWVYKDYTDPNLNHFIAKLIKTYVGVPVGYSKCGYGCSDHASWMAEGIPAAFPVETSFAEHNPFIHTPEDRMSLLNTEHLTNFTKLALAFAIELASE
jgi:leucyl aminopeptidase